MKKIWLISLVMVACASSGGGGSMLDAAGSDGGHAKGDVHDPNIAGYLGGAPVPVNFCAHGDCLINGYCMVKVARPTSDLPVCIQCCRDFELTQCKVAYRAPGDPYCEKF